MTPAIGEIRYFPWDDYSRPWYVVEIARPFNNRNMVTLRRDNSPFYVDQAEITEEMWETGICQKNIASLTSP